MKTRWQWLFSRWMVLGLALLSCRTTPAQIPAAASTSEDWPQFRGPTGTGVGADAPIPLEWSSERHLAWKTPIPGSGWSQPVVVGDLVFVTSAVSYKPTSPKDYESGTSDPYTTSGDKAPPPNIRVEWKVFALDLRTGTIQWERSAAAGTPKFPIHPSNTYASETPAADQEALYVFIGATGAVIAFDHQGQRLWTRQLGAFRQLNNTGTGSSPRLFGGRLFLQCSNEENSFLVCLDTKDGHEKWRTKRERPGTAWNTPFLWQKQHRVELIFCAPSLMTGCDPLTGEELWRETGPEVPLIPSITADAQKLYLGSRDPVKGGALYALRPGRQGNQTPGGEARAYKYEAWNAPDAAPGMASPLVVKECVYALNGAWLHCLDAGTGQAFYKKRLPGFRAVIASPISVADRVVILDESGRAVVVKAGPSFELLGASRLEDRFWASPATSNGALLLRGLAHVYCLRQSPP